MSEDHTVPAIGRPATSALLLVGVRNLDDVARWREKDLLALHGVGPKAVRILREALAAQGRAFTE
jgi:predicted flap endonuclease-1-like 5' DNA nuclease